MKARVREEGYKLEGDELVAAMSSAWRGKKPSAKETETFAREGWNKLLQEIADEVYLQVRRNSA